MNPEFAKKLQLVLMPFFTLIYSIVGLLYFGWSVFHVVYLFWFENFVRILFYRVRIGSVDFVSIKDKTVPARSEGKILPELTGIFYSRLFFYFVYFIFIVIGLGFILPFAEHSDKGKLDGIIAFVSVVTFKDFDFNIALLSCVADELMNYFKDFRINKRYSELNPMHMPKIIEFEDMVLHLTIILTAALIFLANHPSLRTVFESLGPNVSVYALPGIIMAILIFGFQMLTVIKIEKK